MKSARRLIIAMLAILPLHIQAAETGIPGRWYVQMFSVHPGQNATFEQVVHRYKEAAEKLGDQPGWLASSPAVGEDMSTYTFAMAMPSFTMMADTGDAVVQAFGEEAGMEVMKMVQTSVASVHTMVAMHAPELSVPPPNTPTEATLVYEIELKPNRQAEWTSYMMQMVEASKAIAPDARWHSFWGGLGAPANLFAVRVPLNWADLDSANVPLPERLERHFGKRKGEKIWSDSQDMVVSVQTSVVRSRPDLSHMPGQSVATAQAR